MPSTEPLDPEQRQVVLDTARASIVHGLEHGTPLRVAARDYAPALQEERASFVTLQKGGRLRGCIGGLEATMPLIEDVAQHAFDAAFRDPRFPPLAATELDDLEIHVSILTPKTPIEIRDEDDLLRQLRPGVDGLVIEQDGRRATFLPSVWESLPSPAEFLGHLKLKAGIIGEHPGGRLRAWRYTTENIPS